MLGKDKLDCIVIGYNETPFEEYELLLRSYGVYSEAYRDLKFNFVNLDGHPLNYVGLLNNILQQAASKNPSHPFATSHFESGDILNLAAAYLTTYLRRRGIHAEIVNLFQSEKDRLAAYLAQEPAAVAITTTFYVINHPLYEMVQFIRQQNPDVKIVVGGPLIANHARNYDAEGFSAALSDIGADIYVIEGQGEATLSEIVNCLRGGKDLASVPNLAYFEDGKLLRTAEVRENTPLDENFIDWTGFGERDLGPTLQTRTARSCAFNCAFCNYPTRAGKLSLASVDTVDKELETMRALAYVRNVVFIDDTFNVPLPRFKQLCRMMIRRNFGFKWFSYFRCSNSDEETIALMAESGCKGVFLGIESGSPAILKNMNKAATIEKYAEGIRLLHKYQILTFGSFIVGFPGETDETVEESIRFIRENKPTYFRAQLWYCEPGTPIDVQRAKYNTTGSGFVWHHSTMDSLRAMDHIDRMMLSIKESQWLPQWSFDFWIIPYLFGKGMSERQLAVFMGHANRLLSLEIAEIRKEEKRTLQQQIYSNLLQEAAGWSYETNDGASVGPVVISPIRIDLTFNDGALDSTPSICEEPLVSIDAASNGAGTTALKDGRPLETIRRVLNRHPDVTNSLIIDRHTSSAIRRVAYYSSRTPIEPATLSSVLAGHVDAKELPDAFIHLHKLPLKLDGTPNREALPEVDHMPRPMKTSAVGPRTPNEETVMELWERMLGTSGLGVHDSFQDVGGTAAQEASLLAQLRDVFGLTSPLPPVSAIPTIADQALAITNAQLLEESEGDIAALLEEISRVPESTLAGLLAGAAKDYS
ncbi:MAG TPA: PhpK family radical SAM P-methyltransferase [Bryobacteraceae bacterium]|nr:PhpK family radical SAM P-methyltransferase [Bryobacteraceae bacterium]